ncbi:hypothetical protein N7456_007859 [Penicillium angulare]|uniref:chitinase n=1 Tax=Penicillium angulare TaxID=116970 RepID=A0A9W9K8N5_9EURO|nr:hypothetical protein N7456_007859 [Penicillium angulare]
MEAQYLLAILFALLLSSIHAEEFYSQRSRCPLSCSVSGLEPANWTYYHNTNVLIRCRELFLLDLNLHNPVNRPKTHLTLRACLGSEDFGVTSRGPVPDWHSTSNKSTTNTTTFGTGKNDHLASATRTRNVQLVLWDDVKPSNNTSSVGDVAVAAKQLARYLRSNVTLGERIMMASYGDVILGVYVGSQVDGSSAASLVDNFAEIGQSDHTFSRYAAQVCGDNSSALSSGGAFGVIAETSKNLSVMQTALQKLSQNKCLDGFSRELIWSNMSLVTIPDYKTQVAPGHANNTHDGKDNNHLVARDTCQYTQVVAGDGCWALAQRCGITQEQLEGYNGGSNFCNSLLVGQYVCCSDGTLPDFSPQPNPDGSCFSYTVVAGDLCSTIASAHSMESAKIEDVNTNTWGWQGCGDLQIGMKMCLSTGSPPMPAVIPNSICGPQVSGTTPPTDGTALADLNPCPLNACCDVWGQCGITPQFCTATKSTTGAPGTAASGTNGCISNCGTNITNNVPGKDRKKRVGYFEAFNVDRPCLHMKPSDIDITSFNHYSHIQYAFGSITSDFNVDVSAYPQMFDNFVKLKGIKRILSFGGWTFSTNPDTYQIFRLGVSEAQRATFAKNVVDFANQHNLDGLDFDWEYPGATDIRGVPPGSPEDGTNYLEFLKLVKAALPDDKTVSIAAPASYWYLRGFPIAEISKTVDYIVFMTYDLHGQWDYDNAFADDGCPHGNCLRSHVNFTETYHAVAMITKAGVPLNQILIGMARYGRSFEMAEAGCTGPECLFTGPASGALPGPCTNTSGYISNYEINEIISQANDPSFYETKITRLKDNTADAYIPVDAMDGDILVYGDTQWVSYMSQVTYGYRLVYWSSFNIGGWVDWAVDLSNDYSGSSPFDGSEPEGNDNAPCDFTKTYNTLDDLISNMGALPKECAEIIAVNTISSELDTAIANYTSIDNDYDKLFDYYVEAIKNQVPDVLNAFMNPVGGPGNKYFKCEVQMMSGNGDEREPSDVCPLKNWLLAGYYSYYTLIDKEGFYADLLKNYGIAADWVKFGEYEFDHTAGGRGDIPAPPSFWIGYPMAADNIKPANPKAIVTAALPNMTMLQTTIDSTWMNQMLGQWDGSGADPVQVLSMPVALIQQAIESMAQVKKIGEAQLEADRKKLIIEVLTAVFAIVPFVGGLTADIVGLAELSTIIAIVGEISNSALGIYTIVNDPSSAPMVIFGSLLGLGGLGGAASRGERDIEQLGQLRRGMSAEDVSKLGTVFSAQTSKIKTIVKRPCG